MNNNTAILIKNGHIIDPMHAMNGVADLYIQNGKIASYQQPPDNFVPTVILDAKNMYVVPGFIDLCARLQKPNLERRTTINEEVFAAISAGITTLCCPPDAYPIIDSTAIVEMYKRGYRQAQEVEILPIGALTQNLDSAQLTEMAALKEVGCVALSNGGYPIENTLVLKRAMEYAATHDITLFILARDKWLSAQGCVHEGDVSMRLGLSGIPSAAETIAIARDLILIEETGVKAHFCRLSTLQSIEMIAMARTKGLDVTADVSINHLHLTHMDVADFNSNCHIQPPVRMQRDKLALIQGLADGYIQAICSDHQPLSEDAKLAPFPDTKPGISGLDSFLPLALKLVDDGFISLQSLIEVLTFGPASILGIDRGHIAVGADADICIFDPEKIWSLNADTIKSSGLNTPFLNWEMKGKVIYTLKNGEIVYHCS